MGMIKLQGSPLFATFNDEQLKKHIESHNAEEKRMLWLGVMLGQNNLLHSDTIIQACVDKFGDDVAKDAKAFMVQQMVDSDKPETYRVEQLVKEL